MEQSWWKTGLFHVGIKISDGWTVEHLMVEQRNILWLNSGTSDGGTVEQS